MAWLGYSLNTLTLLALAVIASEEIAVLPFLHGSYAARLLEAQNSDEVAADAIVFLLTPEVEDSAAVRSREMFA